MSEKTLASSHYMQSDQWAGLRAITGWDTLELSLGDKTVHAYRKKTPAGGLVYIPGFMPHSAEDLPALTSQLKGNLVCKIEPCVPIDETATAWFEAANWKRARCVQYEHTVMLDLTLPENDLWMSMKARARQEINYARRDQVVVEEAEVTDTNLDQMHALLQDTSKRKSFGIREKQGVIRFWKAFHEAGHLKLFFARHDNEIIAGGIFITDGQNTAWYKDAGSLPAYSKLFGPRLLLWEVALKLKAEGYKSFDLGGTPGPDDYEQSPMKGIYIFKSAYAREITTMMPAYELPLRPVAYPLWRALEPFALKTRRVVSKIKGKILGR